MASEQLDQIYPYSEMGPGEDANGRIERQVFGEEKIVEDFTFYWDNYDFLFISQGLGSDAEPIMLGSEPRICRFCSRPNATFSKTAHVVPRLLGNKRLVCLFECDECNTRFSFIEDDLSKRFRGILSVCEVGGYNGIPRLVMVAQRSRVGNVDGHVHIHQYLGEPFIEINDAAQQIAINYRSDSYRPLAVYKCLAKIAYSLLPDNELENFQELRHWLSAPDVEENMVYAKGSYVCSRSILAARSAFKEPRVLLLRRKTEAESPYCIFLLCFANTSMQISVPCPRMDKRLIGKQVSVRFFPHIYMLKPWLIQGAIATWGEELGSSDRKSELQKIKLSYETKCTLDS